MAGRPIVRAALAVIRRGQCVLIGRREADVFLGGLREFPGGKIETVETPAECAVREAREEAGVEIRILGSRSLLTYDYPDRRVILHVLEGEIVSGEPSSPFQWMRPAELRDEEFPPASAPLLEELRAGRPPRLTHEPPVG